MSEPTFSSFTLAFFGDCDVILDPRLLSCRRMKVESVLANVV
jgi:hypothetical protein